MSSPLRIVILMAGHSVGRIKRYVITAMAKLWEADGHDVAFTYGYRDYEPGDVGIVHVGLTEVPEEYIELASRYPVALNAGIPNIRKSLFSRQQLHRGDDWTGSVIVKSDLNWAGVPEYRMHPQLLEEVPERFRFRNPHAYEVLDRLEDVPDEVFDTENLIVEKFLPEIENGRYHTRIYLFMGEAGTAMRSWAPTPIVKSQQPGREPIEVHPDVLELRREIGIDYGKIDYGVVDGRAVVYDINKTTGLGPQDGDVGERYRTLADGLYEYVASGD